MIHVLLAIVLGAKDVHFELPSSGYRFDAAEGGADMNPATRETRFLFRGHAVASSQEMLFEADAISGRFVTPKGSKTSVLQHAETSGPGTLTHTAKNDGGTEVAVIRGSRFVFDGDAATGRVKIEGPVRITDGGNGKSELRMSGSSGTAQFDMRDRTARDALQGATLEGNVVVDVAESGKDGGAIHATGDRLILDETRTPHTLVLEGHVSVHGSGSSGVGSARGIQKVKFLLNRQGQFTDVNAGGAPN